MKKIAIIIILFLISNYSFSQTDFDKVLYEISTDLAEKLNTKNIKKIVVLYITDINKLQTTAGKYIADGISFNVVNNPSKFQVFDRENLSEIIEAKKLIDEGYIDAVKAKELGKLLAVETIITGNYTVLSNTLTLSLKAFDVNSGFIIAATRQDLPLNSDAGALLGINISNNESDGGNRGFNTPIKSGENYNNPGTVSNECEIKNTGDYCFTNNTQKRLEVFLYIESSRGGYGVSQRIKARTGGYMDVAWSGGDITIEPGQSECFYNLKATSLVYDIRDTYRYRGMPVPSGFNRKGNIIVEKCKSKTFVIK